MPDTIDLHRRHWMLVAVASAVTTACGGGSDSPEPTVTPSGDTGQLSATSYPASATSAQTVIDNGKGQSVAVWQDPSTQQLTQALYNNGSTQQVRVYYGSQQEVQRIVNEATGSFITVTQVTNTRNDYNLYNAAGQWQSGQAIIANADGSYARADILSTAGLQGQQINGNLSGTMVASYALMADSLSGLGPLTPISAHTLLAQTGLDRPMAARRARSVIEQATDLLIPSAQAQSAVGVSTTTLLGLIKGAFWATAGGLAWAAGVELLGVALMAYGAYKIGQGLANIIDGGLSSLDSANHALLDASYNDMAANAQPVSTLLQRITDYVNQGQSALPSLSTVLSRITQASSTAASPWVAGLTSAWTAIVSGPPVGISLLNGILADNQGGLYPTTGTYNPSQNALTFQTSTINGVKVSGSGNLTSQSGTFTVNRNGTETTGALNTNINGLGACETQQASGGQGAFTKVYDLGQNQGTFSLSYQMYSIPDALDVLGTDGTSFFSTGGLVSGGKTVQVSFQGGRYVVVKLYAPNSATAWDYTLNCPTP